jgi:hypothetical protein
MSEDLRQIADQLNKLQVQLIILRSKLIELMESEGEDDPEAADALLCSLSQ